MSALGTAVGIVGGVMGTLVGILTTLSNNHLLAPLLWSIVAAFTIWKGIVVGGAIVGMIQTVIAAAPGFFATAAAVWAIAWPILAIAAAAATVAGLIAIMIGGGAGVAKAQAAIRQAAGSDPGHPSVGPSGGGVRHLIPRAIGGPVLRGQGYWVGENGPEPFYPSVDGMIAPRSGGGTAVGAANHYYTINVVSNDGQAVVNALKKFMRQNGSVPITVSAARRVGAA